MIDSLYLVSGMLRWLMVVTYKRFIFINLKILKYLSKYFFREINFKNIYTKNIENEKIMM
jgi:hypothetical protein